MSEIVFREVHSSLIAELLHVANPAVIENREFSEIEKLCVRAAMALNKLTNERDFWINAAHGKTL